MKQHPSETLAGILAEAYLNGYIHYFSVRPDGKIICIPELGIAFKDSPLVFSIQFLEDLEVTFYLVSTFDGTPVGTMVEHWCDLL